MKLTDIKPNPNNPRLIKDEKFAKLKQSIKEFPKMMELRPMVLDKNNIVLGGNMRLKALKELGYTEVPNEWIKRAETLTDEEIRRFIIVDNVGFGEHDWEMLANEWDVEQLDEWGLSIPNFSSSNEFSETDKEQTNEDFFVPDCIYPSNNIYDIPTLKIEAQGTYPELPIKPYGADRRTNGGVGTYHFYVDDYRFEAIWKNPVNILKSGCASIVEPNLSLYDTTPISYGIFLIYKKRWIARFFQEKGIKVFADLNVSVKFAEYNVMGIPVGYNAFFTRGYTGRLQYLIKEHDIAKKISEKAEPNLIVYGGGKEIKQYCADSNLTYIQDFIND